MAHAQFMDELIREYLIFRGFTTTLKAFDNELKTDKDKAFRVDRIVEQIMQYITNSDLKNLRELWSHLDTHLFVKLDSSFLTSIKKMENAVYKLYLTAAIANNRTDKVGEFFTKLTSELQQQTEWKDWFILPYIKSPEENPVFSVHFTKYWQETLLISLHNFLSVLFQHMPLPTLLHYEEDAKRVSYLEQRNESLKKRLTLVLEHGTGTSVLDKIPEIEPPSHLLDDFYIIAQESTTSENQVRTLKNLIKNMSNTSPTLSKK